MNRKKLLGRLSRGELRNVAFKDIVNLMLEKAKQAWLEAAQQSGRGIPPPTYRPTIYQAVP